MNTPKSTAIMYGTMHDDDKACKSLALYRGYFRRRLDHLLVHGDQDIIDYGLGLFVCSSHFEAFTMQLRTS